MELLIVVICFIVGWLIGSWQVRSGYRCPDCGRRTCPNHDVQHVYRH